MLPDQTGDDTDLGWGDPPYDDRESDRDLDRLRAERPPHYDDRD